MDDDKLVPIEEVELKDDILEEPEVEKLDLSDEPSEDPEEDDDADFVAAIMNPYELELN